MAPLYLLLKAEKSLHVQLCITSQHKQLLQQVLDFFEINPDYDLDSMVENQSLNQLSATILKRIESVLSEVNPEIVLVHGDTTTAAMVAIAAYHKNCKVGHIEAGLRTFNKNAPFPEEINRQIISRIADYNFAPTKLAAKNLKKEGIASKNITITGNTVVDALIWTKLKISKSFQNYQIQELEKKIGTAKLVLVTGHRRENFGNGFIDICNALLEISKIPDVIIIFPLHLNPKVANPVTKQLGKSKNIILIPAVEYPVMVWLMQKCTLIISDSGGIQEEAPTFNKTILVTRQVTERPEGIKKGFSILVGTNTKLIVEKTIFYLNQNNSNKSKNPYGDGQASQRITNFLLNLKV
jgi:UDP-N-acetylglucosamine 2-epimerase (non-hydrolysing)